MILISEEEELSLENNAAWRKIVIILLTLIVSFLYGVHHLFWLHDLHWDYKNAVFVTSFKPYDANHYLAQIEDVYDGNYLMSNAFIAEYKNTVRPFWPPLPFYLVVLIGKLLHIEVQYLAVLMDFTLPPLIFLLAYLFLAIASGKRRVALLGAFILVLMPHIPRISVLIRLGGAFLQILKSFDFSELVPALWHAHAYHNGFARQINPQLTFTFLQAALLFFLSHLITARRRHLALTILFGVITSYSYVYFSMYLYLFWSVFAVISAFLKKKDEAKSALFALSITLVFAAPFWYSVFDFSETELTQITIMTKTHAPILTPQVIVTLMLCGGIVMLLRKGIMRQLPGITALSLLLSAIGALNQRVITGLEVQSWHYQIHLIPQATILATALIVAEFFNTHQRFRWNKPIHIAAVMAFAGAGLVIAGLFINPAFVTANVSPDGVLSPRSRYILRGFRILAGITGVILVAATFCSSRNRNKHRAVRPASILYALAFMPFAVSVGAVQYQLYHGYLKPHLGYMQELAPALRWLNTHTEKESVVLCSLNYTTPHVVIPIYTHNNLYIAPLAGCYPVPTSEEIRDRMYNILYVMGVTSRQDLEQYWPRDLLKGSFAEYRKKLKQNLYETLTTYRIDYLFYGPRERISFKFDPGKTYPFLKRVYQDQVVTIYRIMESTLP